MKSFIISSFVIATLGGSIVYFLAGDSLQKSFLYLTSESQLRTPSAPQTTASDKSRTAIQKNTYIGNGNKPAPADGMTADKKTDERTKEAGSKNRNFPPSSGSVSKQTVNSQNKETSPKSLNYLCMKCGKITALVNDSHVEICKYCQSRDLIELPTNTGKTPQEIIRQAINAADEKTPGTGQGIVIRQAIEATELYSRSLMEK